MNNNKKDKEAASEEKTLDAANDKRVPKSKDQRSVKAVKKWIFIGLISLAALIVIIIATVIIYAVVQHGKMYQKTDIVKREGSVETAEAPETNPVESDEIGTDANGDRVVIEPDNKGNTDAAETDPAETDSENSGTKPDKPVQSEKLKVWYSNDPIYEVEQKNADILNILVLGTDSRDVKNDRGRSDSMIVVSYNKKTHSVKMTSLLRDALVPLEPADKRDWNRLNTAYFFGGPGLAVNTVNTLFDLDIQRYVVLNMEGTCQLIDKLGGVNITLTQAEVDYFKTEHNVTMKVGVNHMNGEQALMHMRNRTTDSDFGRVNRQKDVITALLNETLSTHDLGEILAFVDYATTITKTNIEFFEMTDLATSVVMNKDKLNIESTTVPFANDCSDVKYKGMVVLSFDIEKAARRINDFIYE